MPSPASPPGDPSALRAPLPDYMEVEIGSYCNRRCTWCPNGWHERGQRREHMSPQVWEALLDDLGRYGYRGWFAFHNYNEPLADPTLFDKIAQLRRAVRLARPVVYSNGELLDRPALERLQRAGVREVRVTRYPARQRMQAEPDPQPLVAFLQGLGIAEGISVEDRGRRLVALARAGRVTLLVGAPRIRYYTSRGGSVGLSTLAAERPRDWPCHYPVTSAAIDYHGNLKLCCHIYDTLRPESRPYVLGNVGEVPFTELWTSALTERRRAQLAQADFEDLPACKTCRHRMTERMLRRVEELSRRTGA